MPPSPYTLPWAQSPVNTMKNKNFSDWIVALAVIACSAVLFLALAFALSGTLMGKPSRTLLVNFHDVTGINLGARVKYSGAIAGKIADIRMLTAEESKASGDPLNAVQVSLALYENVPPLPADIKVSVSADTLLSDKFLLLSGGSANAPRLAANTVLQGITPTPFDQLVRNADEAIEGLRGLLGGTQSGASDIFGRLGVLLNDTQSLITDAKPVVQDARSLTTDARQLIADTKEPIVRTIGRLDQAADQIQQLATKGNTLVAGNEKKINGVINNLSVTSENFKITSTYTKILARSLTEKPAQLIWGGRPPPLPTEAEILRAVKPLN